MSPTAEEIDLHGLTVDEAVVRLEEFLYAAYRAGHHRVWVVHGRGTGILKQEVGRYLSGNSLVRAHRQADGAHGGVGATEVDLSDY